MTRGRLARYAFVVWLFHPFLRASFAGAPAGDNVGGPKIFTDKNLMGTGFTSGTSRWMARTLADSGEAEASERGR